MGPHGDNTTKYGIEPGLVAKRRYELLINGFNGNQGILHAAATSYVADSPASITLPSTAADIPAAITVSEKAPTPPINTVSEPVSINKELEHKNKNKTDSIDLVNLLIKTVNSAKDKYSAFCRDGITHRRTPPGWLSTFRHNEKGIKKLEQFGDEFQSANNPDLIIEYLHLFFTNPKTTYNNHSFSAFLLDELNLILKQLSFRGAKPSSDLPYTRSHWSTIHGQCQELAMKDERSAVMVLSC